MRTSVVSIIGMGTAAIIIIGGFATDLPAGPIFVSAFLAGFSIATIALGWWRRSNR